MNTREEENKRTVAALKDVGLEVNSVYDLVNSSKSYPTAIPVLLRLLNENIEDAVILEGIVRALAVKEARGIAARPLIEQFKSLTMDQLTLKWVVSNTLSIVADDSVLDDLLDLVKDKRHGKAREMLTLALCNMSDPRVTDVLVELLDDDEVVGHALKALRRLKAKKGINKIERLTKHKETWVSNEAKRTLAQISK